MLLHRLRVERLERVDHLLALRAEERVLGRTPALRDDLAQVVVERVLDQRRELGHSLNAFGLGHGAREQDDRRAGRHRVRPLDVERGLESPVDHVAVRGVERHGAERAQHRERRRGR